MRFKFFGQCLEKEARNAISSSKLATLLHLKFEDLKMLVFGSKAEYRP